MPRLTRLLSALLFTLACSSKPVMFPHVRRAGSTNTTPSVGSAAWVVDQFYDWMSFPDQEKYSTSNFARRFEDAPNMGSMLQPSITVSSRPLLQQAAAAVYETSLYDPKRHTTAEWYTFLKREAGTWKIADVRTMQLPKDYYTIHDSLVKGRKIPGAAPDLQKSMELTMSSDSAIKAYLVEHITQFDALVRAFTASPSVQFIGLDDSAAVHARIMHTLPSDKNSTVRTLLEQANVMSVFRNGKYPGCTFVRIGGVWPSHVGYLYAPHGCTVPGMRPETFIYVEPVTRDWYVYKVLT